ncbi:MAG: tyrosine-type recombinase/integrase [Bacteroidia bacterium]|nr:tyrosine-type recombinase/integrase [Bacteroidia bacterium]
MKTNTKILLYLSKKKINKKGESPIYCRITVKGKRSEISTGVFTSLNKWDNGKIKGSETQNSLLEKILSGINEIKNKFVFNNLEFTAESIKQAYLYKSPILPCITVQQLFDEFFESEKKRINKQSETLTYYKRRIKPFLAFLAEKKSKGIAITEIKPRLADELTDWLLITKNYNPNYALKIIQISKMMFNFALKKQYVTMNPFAFVKIKGKQKPLIVLSKEELNSIMNHKFAIVRLQQVADLFLLQCFTGMAYVDIMNFDKKTHLQNDFICINRQKSETESLIPVLPQTRSLLEKYGYQIPKISNQKYNSYIKEVAEIVGIEKPLTTHIGRKTCGSILLNEGVSIEVVSRILGHRDTKITQHIYARVNELRITREMGVVNIEIKKEIESTQLKLPLA